MLMKKSVIIKFLLTVLYVSNAKLTEILKNEKYLLQFFY